MHVFPPRSPAQAFAGSFCGAATAFGGWIDDSTGRWRERGAAAAAANLAANLAVAAALIGLFRVANGLLEAKPLIDTNHNNVTEIAEVLAYAMGAPPPPPPPVKKLFGLF